MLRFKDPRAELIESLDEYQRHFEWFCFCLSCGHAPAQGHQPLQRLYRQHEGSGDSRTHAAVYTLVSAHWDAVNAAYDLAGSCTTGLRAPAQKRLRQSKAWHRVAVQALREAWQR